MTHKKPAPEQEIIEAEVIDENGVPVSMPTAADNPRLRARPKGDTGGLVGGFFVLAFGFLVTLLVAAFTVFIVLPLALIGRILGMQIRTLRR